jgi:GrpB-like predicted nucleotidyltransferase (UPF0157 family)
VQQGSPDRGSWYRPARIHLVDYDEGWPRLYAEEAAQVARALGDQLVAIEHVGSTAVAGMPAKPIIDVLVAVVAWDHFEEMLVSLQGLGFVYTPESEEEDPNRRVFRKGPADMSLLRTHHLHMTESGSVYWKRVIAFRDQLRAEPSDALAYAELKRQLAKTFEHDSRSYTSGKDGFVTSVERKRAALG